MIRYVFREDGPVTFPGAREVDPNAIGKELEALTVRDADELQADKTWRWAQDNPQSELYNCFTWNVQQAAEKTWRDEARCVIRSLRRIDDNDIDPGPKRVYLSVNYGGTAYRRVDQIKKSTSLQQKLLDAAKRDLEAWQRRYESIEGVCEKLLQEAMDRARAARGRRRRSDDDEARPHV